jgi:hypothetical protein
VIPGRFDTTRKTDLERNTCAQCPTKSEIALEQIRRARDRGIPQGVSIVLMSPHGGVLNFEIGVFGQHLLHSAQEIHIILDNLSAHKPTRSNSFSSETPM